MDEWQHHEPESEEGSDNSDPREDQRPVALVSTREELKLRIEEVEDDRAPEDMTCMGTFIDDRMIARAVVPPELLHEVEQRNIFAAPVKLALAAVEEDPGLQCRLFALIPAQLLHNDDEPEEPWSHSVPRFEFDQDEEIPEGAMVPVLLGHVVRFQRDRKHPDDLAVEAADILRTVISNEKPLTNVIDKVLEDLLGD